MKKIFQILVIALVAVSLTAYFSEEPTLNMTLGVSALLLVGLALVPKSMNLTLVTIPFEEARPIVTNATVAVYREVTQVSSFLRSFFPSVYKPTKYVNIEVLRGTEKIAVDVLRGDSANLNRKSRSTQKTILPAYYAEGHFMNELDIYDVAFGSTGNPEAMVQLASESAMKLVECRNKIERAYEKQCADAIKSGIITLTSGDNIDFKRKTASMVDGGAGTYWTVNTVDPATVLENAANFIRSNGKYTGGEFNVIMGAGVFNALTNNEIFQAKYDIKDMKLGEISEPQRMSNGGVLHGRVSAGSYNFILWSYPEMYEDANGNMVNYLEDGELYVLPTKTNFLTANALTPRLPNDTSLSETEGGAYVLREYIDPKHVAHVQEIMSAGIAIPLAIDTIYSVRVVAAA